MTTFVLDSEQFKSITNEAIDQIKLGSTNDWINSSSLIRRAYYFGMLNALTPISSDADIQVLWIKILKETMYSSGVDIEISQAIDKWKNR